MKNWLHIAVVVGTMVVGSTACAQTYTNPYTGNTFNNPTSSFLDTVILHNMQRQQLMTSLMSSYSNQGDRAGVMSKVPAGRYILTARSVDAAGTVRPVLVGTECGSPTNPQGGNFARSLPVTLESIKNQWGNIDVRCRQPIWFRP